LQDHVELPPGYNPRTLALAQQLRREHAWPIAITRSIDAVLDRLRTGGYTLHAGAGRVRPAHGR
jgi:hypothetical protein